MFGISPPGCQSPVEYLAFNSFIHHQQKVENFIDALIMTDDPSDYWTQQYVANQCDVDIENLSDNDREYIEREVSRRCL